MKSFELCSGYHHVELGSPSAAQQMRLSDIDLIRDLLFSSDHQGQPGAVGNCQNSNDDKDPINNL